VSSVAGSDHFLKTTAIHLIRVWQLSDAERIAFCFASEDIHLEQKETINNYSTAFSFQKHQLPIWLRLTNQTLVDIHRFAADQVYSNNENDKWQLDIAIPQGSERRLNAIEQAVLALVTDQPDAYAQRIIVRPYKAIWSLLNEAKQGSKIQADDVKQLT
jgi:hypothetical protein